jgi:hypothetical protein
VSDNPKNAERMFCATCLAKSFHAYVMNDGRDPLVLVCQSCGDCYQLHQNGMVAILFPVMPEPRTKTASARDFPSSNDWWAKQKKESK